MTKQKAVKPPRWPEESEPSRDFITILLKLGPRPNERHTTFVRRIAGLSEGRKEWCHIWRKANGKPKKAAELMQIPVTSVSYELSIVGLTPGLLRTHCAEILELENSRKFSV